MPRTEGMLKQSLPGGGRFRELPGVLKLAWLGLLCLASLLAFGAMPAWAQQEEGASPPPLEDLGLEELLRQPLRQVPRDVEVSTASRFAQSAAQAPTTTYVVTAADISRFGFRNLADILRAMPGLYVTKGYDFSYVGSRGLGRPGDLNARLLFLVDGMRMNDNVYDAGQIGEEFFVDVGLIERVEFTPGPGSALYGNNAFLGVVQVMTKRADKLAGAETFASIDSEGVHRLRASWGHRSEAGWEAWIAASEIRQDHRPQPFDVSADVAQAQRDRLWLRGKRVLTSFSAQGWSVRGGVSELKHGAPSELLGSVPLRFEQAQLITDDNFLSLSHERSLGPDWDLFAGFSVKRNQYRELSPWQDPETQQAHVFAVTAFGRWWNADLRLSTRRWAGHRLMAGLDYQRDEAQEISVGLEGDAPFQLFYGINRRIGLFVQDEWQLTPTQSLVLGLRRDSSTVSDASISPRLAWVWNGVPDATFRLMYGRAFRAVNLNEFAINSYWEVPLPQRERINSFEASWEHALTPTLQYRVSVYHSKLSDLIDQNQVDLPIFENSKSQRSLGSDLDLEQRWSQGGSLRLGLSMQRSRDAAGQSLSNSPTALFKLFFSQPLIGDALQLSWQMFAMSRRFNQTQPMPGYCLNNVILLWRPSLDLDVSVGLYNLGDVRYIDRPSPNGRAVKQERRTGQISLRWSFGR